MHDWSVKGRRVRLVLTADPHTRLSPGELGTASFYDDFGTLHVKWDDGSSLGLIPDVDEWEILSPAEVAIVAWYW
jgi:hypothetical protein